MTEKRQIVPAKIGLFGPSGSGKTTTAALLAVATSVELHDRAPVYVYDSEPGWQFVRDIFDTEGVKLIHHRERAFKAMCDHLKIAEREGACVFAADSMTHMWTELMDTFAGKNGRVEFQDFNLIKRQWNNWTMAFLNSPLHCYALGRLGYDYDTVEKEGRDGRTRKEIVKGDSKFKAGGGESFGYEPHLLIEMELAREGAKKGHGGKLVHVSNVLKDRTRALNGKTFEFVDFGEYKKGDYHKVWDAFLPHLNKLQLLEGHPAIIRSNSADLVPESDSEWYRKQQEKKIALESIEATMGTKLWPGTSGEAKKIKLSVLEKVFGTRSWTEVEQMPLHLVKDGLDRLLAFEKSENKPDTETAIIARFDELAKAAATGIAEVF